MRTQLAQMYQAAPRARVSFELAIEAGGVEEITDLLPTKAILEMAPSYDLLLGYEINDPALGPAIAIGSAGTAAQATYQRTNRSVGLTVARARGVLPRLNAAATTLTDGTRVFIVNLDPDNPYTTTLYIEQPSLNTR